MQSSPASPWGSGRRLAGLEDDVGDVRERRADGDGLPRPQALAARVGARLGGSVGVDDLPPAPGPRLHEGGGKGLARRDDEAADRVREIQLGGRRERGQQDGRAEEHGDLGLAEDGDEVRAGPDLLLRQQDHGAPRDPGAVHLGDAAVVAQGRGERGGVQARHEIEVVGVGQGEVHVAGVRALHPLGHPGGSARVEDAGETLPRVVQPGGRLAAALRLGQGQDVEGRQAAEVSLPAREDDHRPGVLEHVGHEGVRQRGVEEHHRPAGLQDAEVGGHDLRVVLLHRHGDDLVRAREPRGERRGHGLGARVELGEGQGLSGVGNLQGREIGVPRGGAAEDLRQPPHPLLVRDAHGVPAVEDVRQAVRTGVLPASRPLADTLRGTAATPRTSAQREGDYYKDGCQNCPVTIPMKSRTPERRHDLRLESARRSSTAKRMPSRSIAPVSLSADVQRHAVEPAAQHLRVPQLERDDIQALLLQEPDQSGLVPIDHDQIRD